MNGAISKTLLVNIALLLLISGRNQHAVAQPTLHGTVRDRDTGKVIPFVSVILDSSETILSNSEGVFDFGSVARGKHILIFDHIAYRRLSLVIDWPSRKVPIAIRLDPSQFAVEKIVVTEKRVLPSIPVGAVSLDRDEITYIPGNIANDPLRTVQSQPSCAAGGVDFLSKTAVRGGDTEEHRVFLDGYPLRHYAHVGGFAGVVYDDMLAQTILIPGAAPIKYTGTLSGIIAFNSIKPDTSFRSFRYDVTSMAGGVGQVVSPKFSFQASAKTSFFNLPVYQEVGVKERSLRDFLGRAMFSPNNSVSVTGTVLLARDSETGEGELVGFRVTEGEKRELGSVLAGANVSYRPPGWELSLRPSYTLYDSEDALTFPQDPKTHRLQDTRVFAEARRGSVLGVGVSGAAGTVRHSGSGGRLNDSPYSASTELKVTHRDAAALVLGAGGSREPWTSSFEPEAYGSVRLNVGNIGAVSAGYRRSHQSPFLFSERRFFASLPIDAGDLLNAYAFDEVKAVRMDQASLEATISLPFKWAIEGNGFQRTYENLLTWDWATFPSLTNVTSDGDGHGSGYEIVLTRNDPDFLSVMISMARAKVYKQEGTLDAERLGDFDRPRSWQVGLSAKLTHRLRVSLRWMDVEGRPYTEYDRQSVPPATDQINSMRLSRFRRLDAKIVYATVGDTFDGDFFVDIINLLNRDNIATRYALEVDPGTFTSVPYGGAKFFPIVGGTLRW